MVRDSSRQENFWAGKFGDDYIERNASDGLLTASIALFADIFKQTQQVGSIIEFGANRGLNLKAINALQPQSKLTAVEINERAIQLLKELPYIEPIHSSIQDFESEQTWEMTFTRGVLIHINPDDLPSVYGKLYQHSSRFIMLAEYYSRTPMELDYRGHSDKLYKRDFAGEMMDLFPDITLRSYGFQYHRDTTHQMADINWFLMEKSSEEFA